MHVGYLQRNAYLTLMPHSKNFFPKGFEMEQVRNGSNSTKAVKIPNMAHSGWYRKHSDILAVFKLELKLLV